MKGGTYEEIKKDCGIFVKKSINYYSEKFYLQHELKEYKNMNYDGIEVIRVILNCPYAILFLIIKFQTPPNLLSVFSGSLKGGV